jgi:hypothetical protein
MTIVLVASLWCAGNVAVVALLGRRNKGRYYR